MTLGERICAQRMARKLSQHELAEALGVSRQSVSKWETDASVPDLDKLVKLCELFDLSLDQLVRGNEPETASDGRPEEAPSPASACEPRASVSAAPREGGLTVRTAAGLLLLFLGALVLLLCTLAWGAAMESVVLAIPFLLCGAICLICKRHPALICGWVLWGMAAAVLPSATGIHIWRPSALAAMVRMGAWVQAFLAGWIYLLLAALAAGTLWQLRKWLKARKGIREK